MIQMVMDRMIATCPMTLGLENEMGSAVRCRIRAFIHSSIHPFIPSFTRILNDRHMISLMDAPMHPSIQLPQNAERHRNRPYVDTLGIEPRASRMLLHHVPLMQNDHCWADVSKTCTPCFDFSIFADEGDKNSSVSVRRNGKAKNHN